MVCVLTVLRPLYLGIILSFGISYTDCSPQRQTKRGVPNYSTGVDCDRQPSYGEYCDRYGSGTVKNCSPCSRANLVNPDIAHPEECDFYCPDRCPEGLDESEANRAPADSCDVTTTAATSTQSLTTVTSKVVTDRLTTETTTGNSSRPTSHIRGTTPATPNEGNLSSVPAWIIAVVIAALAFIALCCVGAWLCVRRKNSKGFSPRAVPNSSSGDELLGIELPSTSSAETAPTISVDPGLDHLVVTSDAPGFLVQLGCSCADGAPITIDPDGARIAGLLKGTTYNLDIGRLGDDGAFQVVLTQEEHTRGALDYEKCPLTLHDCREDPDQFVSPLLPLFSQITDKRALRAVVRALQRPGAKINIDGAVKRLHFGEVWEDRWMEILQLDSEWQKDEDESVRVNELLNALLTSHANEDRDGDGSAGGGGLVAKIIAKLSSLHPNCLPCQHLGHYLTSRPSLQASQDTIIDMV